MAQQNFVKFIPLATFDSAGLIVTYQSMNPAGFEDALFALNLLNDSSTDVYVSFDGIVDHIMIPAGQPFYLPTQMNAVPASYVALIKARTQVYLRSTAPGIGNIYLSGYYV